MNRVRPVVPGCTGCAMARQILADQLTLCQPGGTDYAHLITTGTPGISGHPTALKGQLVSKNQRYFFRISALASKKRSKQNKKE